MKLTYFGHSCFAVEVAGSNLLFDPFIRPNPKAAAVDVAALRPDMIFITHGHEDHLADAIEIAQNSGAVVVANWEVAQWLSTKGVEKSQPMNHGGTKIFEFGSAKMVNAVHSSTLPDGTSGGNPAGFVIKSNEGNFYVSGDTALTWDMKLIAEEVSLKFAVLPIGDTFTMGVSDAIRAAKFCAAPAVVGVHYDTFPPIEIDHAAATASFAKAGVPLLLPRIGETIQL